MLQRQLIPSELEGSRWPSQTVCRRSIICMGFGWPFGLFQESLGLVRGMCGLGKHLIVVREAQEILGLHDSCLVLVASRALSQGPCDMSACQAREPVGLEVRPVKSWGR